MYFCMLKTACFQKCNLISAYVMRYETDMIITCIVGLGDVWGFFGRISWVHHFHFLHPHNLPFARPLDTIWEPELYHTEIRNQNSIFTARVIQELRRLNLTQIWPPTPLEWTKMDNLHTIYPLSRDPSGLLTDPPPSSCPRSYWISPVP